MQNFDAKTSQKVRSQKTKKEMREGNIKMDFGRIVPKSTSGVKYSVTMQSSIVLKYVIVIK
jgi:hypothetical protein